MDLNLKGRVAIITGGASGIGRKICHLYAEEGVHPMIFDVHEENGKKVAKECEEIGTETIFFHADCSDRDACQKAVEETVHRFSQVDILVHCAAPYTDGTAIMPLLKQTHIMWEDFVNTILWGAIYSTEAVLPYMFERQFGRIIYISSDAGRTGDAFQPVYGACKAGLAGFMKSMAQYGGRKNVLANIVSPALTLTEENEQMLNLGYKYDTEEGRKRVTKVYQTGKLATGQDVANMVVFLTSDRAGDVTGQVIGVDGGYFMPSP